jgi:hypothetical protein
LSALPLQVHALVAGLISPGSATRPGDYGKLGAWMPAQTIKKPFHRTHALTAH